MKIRKILNNNAVISENDRGEEIIVMGKGLAFKAKNGQKIDETKIDKVFTLENKDEESHFAKLLAELDLSEIEFAEQLINFAKMELGKSLSDVIYITLIDHINTCKERAAVGAYVANPMTWDLKRLYRDEFKVAQEMVRQMNVHFGSNFDDSEAANITTHLINAEKDLGLGTVVKVTRLVSEVLNIVKYEFRLVYDEEALSYYRFITHLQFFAERLFSDKEYTDDSHELYDLVKDRYPEAFPCALKIVSFVKRKYGYTVSDEETAYLTVHIAKLLRDSRDKNKES